MKKIIALACLTIAVAAVLAISISSAFAANDPTLCENGKNNATKLKSVGAAKAVYVIICPED